MPKIPEPILTPQDAAWGRWVNERILAQDASLDRQGQDISSISRSTSAALGQATVQENRIAVTEASNTPPNTPGNTTYATNVAPDAYGVPRGIVSAACDAVTGAGSYELHGRPTATPDGWTPLATTTAIPVQLSRAGLPVGESWDFKIRALSRTGVPGGFSVPTTVVIAKDLTAPNKPATPTATSRLGQIVVSWTGLDSAGGAQPADYSHTDVYMATSSGGAGLLVGRIDGVNTFSPDTQPYNATRWFYLISADYAGNQSTPSDRVSVAAVPLVDTDVIGRVIDGANVKLTSIQGDVIAAGAIGNTQLANNAVDTAKLADSAITNAKLAGNAVDAAKLANGAVGPTQLTTAVNNSISTAQSTANTAVTNAATAQTAANNAQTSANQASTDAAAAAGIANGKADTLIQSTTPVTAMQKSTTLWIDTTGGSNTPKRWSGSAWVAVTDKAATDAASAAATAQARADSAYTIAGAAQSAASAAQTSANAAQSSATAAQTTANGKNAVVRATGAATGTAYINGDLWFQYSGSNVIGMWIFQSGAWVAQAMANQMVASLDAGKITAGFLDAARIQGASITGTMISGGTITAANMVSGTITAASGIIADAAIGTAKIIDGSISTAKIIDAAITSAKIASLDAGKITAGTLDAARIAAGSITGDRLVANTITSAQIGALAVTAGKIDANAVTATTISAGAITGTKIDANAIDGKTITGALVRSAASGARTEMTSSGVQVLDASGNPLVQMGYGVATGMTVKNPNTGTLMPLASAAFGFASASETAPLTVSFAPSTTYGYQRHGTDNLTLTFTAPSSGGVLSWGQTWLWNSGSFGTQSPVVWVVPYINGAAFTTSSGGSDFPVYARDFPLGYSTTQLEDWYCSPTTSAAIATTAGASYSIQLYFRLRTGTGSSSTAFIVNRFISFQPTFR